MHRRLVVGLLVVAAIYAGGRYAFGNVDQQGLSIQDSPNYLFDGNGNPVTFITITMTSWQGGANGYTAKGTLVRTKDGVSMDPSSLRFRVIRQSDGADNFVVVGINTLNDPWTWECTMPTSYTSAGKNPYYFQATVKHKDVAEGDWVTVPTHNKTKGNYLSTIKNDDEPSVSAEIEDLWANSGSEEFEVGPQSPSLPVEEARIHETNNEWKPRELTISAVEMPYCPTPMRSDAGK